MCAVAGTTKAKSRNIRMYRLHCSVYLILNVEAVGKVLFTRGVASNDRGLIKSAGVRGDGVSGER